MAQLTDGCGAVSRRVSDAKLAVCTLNKWLQCQTRLTISTEDTSLSTFEDFALITVQNPHYLKFLENKKIVFMDFHCCLDSLFQICVKMALTLEVDTHRAFLSRKKTLLWEKGFLSTTSLRALLRTVFYYTEKTKILCGGRNFEF